VFRAVQTVALADVTADRLNFAGDLVRQAAPLAAFLDDAMRADLAYLDALVVLQSGEPNRAERMLGEHEAVPDPRRRIRLTVLRARARLAACRPASAIPMLRDALETCQSFVAPVALEAALHEVLGDALGAIRDYADATGAYERALSAWVAAGDHEQA